MPMRKTYIIVLAIILIFGSLLSAHAKDYVVGIGDILKVTVYDHVDLTTVTRIDGEGQILFPLLGQIKVAALTVSQVSKKISDLLSDGYIVAPQVTVFVEEFRSQKATIMGQVNKPGLYELKGYTTFLEILSKAGDLAKDAGEKAIIKRKSDSPDKSEQTITIDLKRLTKGDTTQDVQVLDGDSIYVVKAGVFYVTGEVKKPDSYKFEDGTTVLKAVTTAGGFSDKASVGRVKIIRKMNDKEEVLEKVKMDVPVLPGDVIVVPESFF
jgi:polysaccharide export outer membrane protein